MAHIAKGERIMGISRARFALLATAATFAAVATLPNISFAVVTTYTTVNLNSPAIYQYPSAPESLTDTTGADTQLGYSGTLNLGYGHYDGTSNITTKPTTYDSFAAASLATGQLKARATIGFGTDVSGFTGYTPVPPDVNNSGSSANAGFADSFTTYSGNTPFLWNNGTQVSLHMAISGSTSIPAGFTSTDDHQYAYALLQAAVYKKGTLDLIDQANNFDFNAYPDFTTALAAYNALGAQITANTVTTANWFLGTPVAYFDTGSIPVVDLSAANPSIDFTFNPNGDFDFTLSELAIIHLDASYQNTSVTLDFSHTIDTTYIGPDGATTFSASGLFPDTLPFSAPINTPEPGTAAVLLLGATTLLTHRKRSATRADSIIV